MDSEKIDSRQRILDSARAEFAERGFDGARVDDIAHRAEVNKALIYYYFKSKDELLQELLRQFLEERSRRRASVDHDPSKRDLPGCIAEFDVEFLFERRDILRIAWMEDLKASVDGVPTGGTILQHWLQGLAEGRIAYAAQGYDFRYTPRVVAALYFYHLMPSLAFATLGETLAKAVGIEHAVLREEFLKLVHETTSAHFGAVFGDSCKDPSPEVVLPATEGIKSGAIPSPQAHLEATEAERRKLVSKHMPKGRLTEFPNKEKARLAVIEHISGMFEPGKIYAEREVDALLKTVADDHTKVRRYLVDYRYLDRTPDGSRYWTWEGPKP